MVRLASALTRQAKPSAEGCGRRGPGRTETFFTEGIESALQQARTAAAGKDVAIAGGARAVQQYLAAGMLDELYLHIVPILLGSGERLLEDVGDPTLDPVKVIASPAVTHVKYRVVR
jgi:dihydrofolate reductase